MKRIIFILNMFISVAASAQVGNFSTVNAKVSKTSQFLIAPLYADTPTIATANRTKYIGAIILRRAVGDTAYWAWIGYKWMRIGNIGGGGTELDPVYSVSTWFSTTNNSSNWNTAFGWGNHATLYPTIARFIDSLNAVQGRIDLKLNTSSSFYNADGSLAGNRVVTLNASSLELAGSNVKHHYFPNGNLWIGTGTPSDVGYALEVAAPAGAKLSQLNLTGTVFASTYGGGSFSIADNGQSRMMITTTSDQLNYRGQFKIGLNNNHTSAALQIDDVNRGFLPPRMTTAQMNAIATPATGLLLYNTDSLAICFYNGTIWSKIGSASSGVNVTSFNGRSGTVTSIEADYSGFYPLLSGSYNNPPWINQLAWSKITSPPAFLLPADTLSLHGRINALKASLDSIPPFTMDFIRDTLGWRKPNGEFVLKSFGFNSSTEMSFSKPALSNNDSNLVYQGILNANSVANSKLVVVAANSLSGNNTGSAATRTDLTVAQVKTMLSLNNVDNTSDATKNSAFVKLTNHRIAPRFYETTATTLTPHIDTFDIYFCHGATLTVNDPTGSPDDGQHLQIISPGVITFPGTAFEATSDPITIGGRYFYEFTYTAFTATWIQTNSDAVSAGGTGITSLGGQTGATQTFATGTAGTDFGISSAANVHTFNVPTSSASNRGLLLANDYKKLFTYQSSANPTGTITHDGNAGSRHAITFTATGARTLAFSNIAAGYLVTFYFDNTSGATVALTLPANGFVQNTSGIYVSTASITIPIGKSAVSLNLYDGTNFWYTTTF